MDLLNLYEKDNIDEIIEFMSQKQFIKNVQTWLKQNNININTRLFISHYLIWKFNIFHGVPNNSLLYESCSKIIESVKNGEDIPYGLIEVYKNLIPLIKWKNIISKIM